MNQIFNGDDTILAQIFLNEFVVSQRDALASDLSVSALVYELTNALEVRFTIGDPRLDDAKHLESGLSKADKDAIVNLEETKELENFARLGGDLVDTVLPHELT